MVYAGWMNVVVFSVLFIWGCGPGLDSGPQQQCSLCVDGHQQERRYFCFGPSSGTGCMYYIIELIYDEIYFIFLGSFRL